MRSFLIASAFLIIAIQCGYPVPEAAYPTAPPAAFKKYPTPASLPTYTAAPLPNPPNPAVYSNTAVDNNSETESSDDSDSEYTTAASLDYRKRAKARTMQNRQFHRRALQPIRKFQKKAKQ